jgi:hypothetical protein
MHNKYSEDKQLAPVPHLRAPAGASLLRAEAGRVLRAGKLCYEMAVASEKKPCYNKVIKFR